MDIEQLKLVLATVQGVSGDAFKVGAIYIAAQFLKELVSYGMWGAALFAAYKVAQLITSAALSSNDCLQAVKRIRKVVGIAHSLGESNYDIGSRQISEAVEAVEKITRKEA